jgi:hypothetical protein
MIEFDGFDNTTYSVKEYMRNKKFRNEEKVIVEESMEKTFLKYFVYDYSYFIKKRKKELVNGNSLLSIVKKICINSKDLYFEENTYQSDGIKKIFKCSFPILDRERASYPYKEKEGEGCDYYKIKESYNAYNENHTFINKETFDLLKNTWKDYIDYLVEIQNTNKEVKLRNNLRNF